MPKTDLVSIPSSCTLCPRRCGADRAAGRTGFCGAGSTLKAARAALHYWEEPCISGTRGSGTVFFSGCTLKCCFCQNYPISAEGLGREITVEHLAEIFLDLQSQGAHNINLVTPGQWQPWIIAALDLARAKGLPDAAVAVEAEEEPPHAVRTAAAETAPRPSRKERRETLDCFIMITPLQNLSHWLRNPRSLYLDL